MVITGIPGIYTLNLKISNHLGDTTVSRQVLVKDKNLKVLPETSLHIILSMEIQEITPVIIFMPSYTMPIAPKTQEVILITPMLFLQAINISKFQIIMT